MASNYAFDPEIVASGFLEQLPMTGMDLGDPAVIAAYREAGLTLRADEPDRTDVTTEDVMVPGFEDDPQVAVRVYRPVADAPEPRGALLYIHGGGFMFGSIDMMDKACQKYAAELDAVVVSVEYRLAPEDPFPAGLNDCYASLVWLTNNVDNLGVGADRIAVGGGSAGGGLAAATALMARDMGGPKLCFQFLQIPELDDRLDTPSMVAFDDTPMWNRPSAVWSWKHYLGPLYDGDVPYLAAPSRCEDLSGLPPAYVSTMEFDPLRDEGIIYGLRMLQAGVQVELHSFPGTFHGSAMVSHTQVAKRESAETMVALRRAIGPRS